jgi:hypothetical protein
VYCVLASTSHVSRWVHTEYGIANIHSVCRLDTDQSSAACSVRKGLELGNRKPGQTELLRHLVWPGEHRDSVRLGVTQGGIRGPRHSASEGLVTVSRMQARDTPVTSLPGLDKDFRRVRQHHSICDKRPFFADEEGQNGSQ